jgi:hypothetical protein
MRFREGRIPVNADKRDVFSRVHVTVKCTEKLAIVRKESSKAEVKTYLNPAQIFGAVDSPTIKNLCLTRTVKNNNSQADC